MISLKTVALALAMGSADASYAKIAGYEPGSAVTEHSRIDISAQSMISSLAGLHYAGGKSDTTSDTAANMYAAAKSNYEKGARSSSVAKFTGLAWVDGNTGTGAGSLNDAGDAAVTAMSEDKGEYECVFTSTTGQTATFDAGTLKGTINKADIADAALEIYLTSAMSTVCGTAPYQGDVNTHVVTYDEPACHVGEATNSVGTPSAAEYGNGAVGTFTAGDEITCTAAGVETIVVTAQSRQLKGRSLKGFSTGGAAKMDGSKGAACKTQNGQAVTDCNGGGFACATKQACEGQNHKWTAAVPQEMEFVMAWQFHGMSLTYADDHVQMALAGLLQTTAATYSTCLNSGTAVTTHDGGGDPTKCAEAGGTFTWGNIVCKKISDRALVIPPGGTTAQQTTACELCADLSTDICGKVTDFHDMPAEFNEETAKKVAVYGNAWMYVIHEFEDAIQDCLNADLMDNDASVHAWDEGVAFYVGSLGADATDTSSTWGKMIYELANKRCSNFDTCIKEAEPQASGTGNSKVNAALSTQWANGQWSCKTGDCAGAVVALDKIKSIMKIPLVQGTLRYAWKMEQGTGGGASGDQKESGEGYAFMLTIAGAISKCNIQDATLIYTAMDAHAVSATGSLGGGYKFADVKKAFEDNYDCLGITCADVGGLLSTTSYHRYEIGTEPCSDGDAASDDHDDHDDEEKMPMWAWIALAGAGVLMLLFFGLMCSARASAAATKNLYQEYVASNPKK
jgi:hypothetical protein